jgi:uroporphyrinogen decarboxylase
MDTNFLLLRAARKEPVERVPVWIMRQAGRYMKEYREIRAKHDFLTMCRTPEIAVEVSMQPVEHMGMDAGIIFSDILIPVEAMGIIVTFEKDHGPKLHNPVKNLDDVNALDVPEPSEKMPFVAESIKLFRRKLEDKLPVLGFSGSPWTLAAYMIEGGGSKNYNKIKSFMFNEKKAFSLLMEKLTETVVKHLYAQVQAGASLVQIFDTWAGCLSPEDYLNYAFPYEKAVIDQLKKLTDTPVTLYINGCGNFLEKMAETGADVLSIDWMTDLAYAKKRVGDKVSLQGNLDPCVLYGEPEFIKKRVLETLNKFGKETGYIFNLGHGILPDIPAENVKLLVEIVKGY